MTGKRIPRLFIRSLTSVLNVPGLPQASLRSPCRCGQPRMIIRHGNCPQVDLLRLEIGPVSHHDRAWVGREPRLLEYLTTHNAALTGGRFLPHVSGRRS